MTAMTPEAVTHAENCPDRCDREGEYEHVGILVTSCAPDGTCVELFRSRHTDTQVRLWIHDKIVAEVAPDRARSIAAWLVRAADTAEVPFG
jgi:hypothetical protein